MSELLPHRLDGDGDEVVLLLNGGMMTMASWEPIVGGLAQGYRALRCDFRGQLRSPGEAHRRLEDNVPDLVALLDALGIEAVHLLGTSFGGEIALLFAALHPDRARTLAAVTAVDRTPPGMRESSAELQRTALEVLAGGDPHAVHDAMVGDVYSAAYRERHSAWLAERRRRTADLPASWYRGLDGILESVADFDLARWLGRIVCPTLVVHAAHDAVMPTERVEALAAAIERAELRVHPSSGHGLVFEDPDWLLEVYLGFLARHGAAAEGGSR